MWALGSQFLTNGDHIMLCVSTTLESNVKLNPKLSFEKFQNKKEYELFK